MLNLQDLNLAKELYYHTVNHVKNVYRAAEAIAENEHINRNELQLLLTAACYHDAGFLYVIEGHEIASCEITAEVLPSFGYDNEDISAINNMIMAIKIPQSPNNLLEEKIIEAKL